jgi:hypothetical protein
VSTLLDAPSFLWKWATKPSSRSAGTLPIAMKYKSIFGVGWA